ncbi:recombinase family protein [Frigidibacter sp. RF13]|uniref:recombinase family protein n=1 Tax=Frigidibacter sp. RF13 TaxID=2997340 RepID=UPI00227227A9|nr:recombinase family protein [Frigidibacter sp. RF13]MCY1128625.1 recombinase family protein [Frigidibacter sp. RF13]
MPKIRCAIYTRKSSEDGLDQQFNSLHAQREACAAYVASQKAEGWVLLPTEYDDGGLSGGTLERPAMQRLLGDVEEGLVDQIVVYKIDRLTRSLADFAKIVERLDAAGASFVSVTQSFNTATSMGRLTLNMLLSFAQFEREVTAERIRDKIAASKRKGLWMGGNVPLGYEADGRTLKINAAEAATVKMLYDLYLRLGTVREVKEEAARLGLRSKQRTSPSGAISGGTPFDRGHIHYLLTNPVFAGRIRHRNEVHEGQHPAIIDPTTWETVQDRLKSDAAKARSRDTGGSSFRSLLTGRLFDETGDRLTPSHGKARSGVRHRYYVSHRLIAQSGEADVTGWRLNAQMLEELTVRIAVRHLGDASVLAAILLDATTDELLGARGRIVERIGDDLPPDVRARAVADLIARVDLAPGRLGIAFCPVAISAQFNVAEDRIDPDQLRVATAFTMRRRGVETKLILGNEAGPPDQRLLTNIAAALGWLDRIKAGKTYAEIADEDGVPKYRVQQAICYAFLAPDIIRQVLQGRQPLGLTSKWIFRHALPLDWAEQRALIARL